MKKQSEFSGIKCDIYRAKNETEHFHQNIELLYIISGHIKVFVEGNEFLVEQEQLLLINSNKMHYTYVDDDSLVCRLNIAYEMLSEMLSEEYIAFWCNILTNKDIGYDEIAETVKEIIKFNLSSDRKDSFRLMERYGRLLNLLVRNYIVKTPDNVYSSYNDMDRIREALNYINKNYQDSISLVGIAEQMYMSVSTLSRIFKKATGMKFPDYVNKIRLHYAIRDLLNTNKSITDIAVDNGFSSPSSFNRIFKDIYNTTPSLYKRNVRSITDKSNAELSEEDEALVRKSINAVEETTEKCEEISTIDIYQNSDRKFNNLATKTVTLGSFFQLTISAVQNQVKDIAEHMGLQYLRMWNIFSPKCMIAEGPEEKNLSFEIIDIVFDFLTELHIHPFLDMTDHPECLIKSGRELFYKKEDFMGFKTLEQWSYFLDKLMSHVVFRYGRDEVSKWIFEFGDMPESSGSIYYENNVYSDLFTESYHVIKSHCDAMVGGPDWVLDGSRINIKKQLDIWEKTGIYPDFISVFMFPYKGSDEPNDLYFYEKERNMDPDFMKNQICELHSMLQSMGVPKRPLYITELSSVLSNRNAMNDHCNRGTSVLKAANVLQDYADMFSFWVATDRQSLHYAPQGILHGGAGMLSKDGVPKPSCFALYFLSKLNGMLIGRGVGYIAVKKAENNIYILCYNNKELKYDYKYEEEKTINVYNVDLMFMDKDRLDMKFMIHGLEAGGEYVIKKHIVNQENGSIMDEWRRLGFEMEMRNNDISYLKSVCVPRIQMGHRVAEEGQIFVEASMKAHEMLLIHLYK